MYDMTFQTSYLYNFKGIFSHHYSIRKSLSLLNDLHDLLFSIIFTLFTVVFLTLSLNTGLPEPLLVNYPNLR